ncbi:MAG: oligosaccharide flippase family protein [Acidobacteria bacterium]|nr:oligosaccharide flippase family protein [Acidobacteriota bacterium]
MSRSNRDTHPIRRGLAWLRGPGVGAVLTRGGGGALVVSLAGTAAGLVCHLVLARWLGESAYGVYAYCLTWITLLALLSRLGLDTALTRYFATYRVSREWALLKGFARRSDQLCVGASLLVTVAGAVGLLLMRERLTGDELGAGLLAAVLVPLLALIGLRKGALQGLKAVVLAQVPDALLRPLVLALLAGLAWWLQGPATATVAMALTLGAWGLSLGAASLWQRRSLPLEARSASPVFRTRQWLRVSLPLLLVSGMRQLLNQTDVLLVGLLLGSTEAGVYFVAARMTQLISFGLVAGNAVAAPLIAESHTEGRPQRLQHLVTLASWGSTATAAGLALALLVLRAPVLELFGKAFVAGGPVLMILALGQIVNAATGPVGQLLNMTGHQDANARILGWITAANLLLSYPAILVAGSAGAAIVTSSLVAIKNLWTWWVVRDVLGVNSSIFPIPMRSRA